MMLRAMLSVLFAVGCGQNAIEVNSEAKNQYEDVVNEEEQSVSTSLTITGMHCGACAKKLQKALKELDFKQRSYSPHLSPTSDPYKIHPKSLEEALAYLGER